MVPSIRYRFDYHPYGSPLIGRTFSSDTSMRYRFGFNGLEKDNNISGEGYSNTTEYRQYDTRLGRWFSIDPLQDEYPSWSPYVHTYNNPISFYDKDGRFGWLGALVAGAVEVGGQMIANKISGEPIGQIDWADVGVAAISGFMGVPPGMKAIAKYGKNIQKLARIVSNNSADALQATFNITEEKGFEFNSLGNAVVQFGFSKVGGTFMSNTNKRIIKAASLKLAVAGKTATKSAKVLKSSKSSLANESNKKLIKSVADEVARKTKNVNNAKIEATQALVEKQAATVIQNTASGVASSSGGGVGNIIKSTIIQPSYTKSTMYKPEALGTTGYYFMDKDHTTVYNTQTNILSIYSDGKLSNNRKVVRDVNQPVMSATK